MSWQPITVKELKGLGRRIDSEWVVADDVAQLYGLLNAKYPHEEWCMLRSPEWIGDKLVTLVVRPRNDEDER